MFALAASNAKKKANKPTKPAKTTRLRREAQVDRIVVDACVVLGHVMSVNDAAANANNDVAPVRVAYERRSFLDEKRADNP